jgi:lipopolysaccharide transport system ATP-binding protein
MNKKIIVVKDISKIYRLGLFNYKVFFEDLKKIFHFNNYKKKDNKKNQLYALNNISFSINEGEKIALIGKNGSGKSTFLKILSRITLPSTGLISYEGKLLSILEQGIGFNPEMTARDNIYLNASFLGFSKKQTSAVMNDIIEFAGIERFIDTPIKRYSSGMLTRLGFSITIHVPADILLVDEVLAVGDKEFREKCLLKLISISSSNHKTIIFVSHEMELLKKLCSRGIVLEKGSMIFDGEISEAIKFYEAR